MREFVASGAILGVIAGLFLTAPANADVVDIGNAAAVRIDATSADSYLGLSMDAAGDFDGDGYDDLILGTWNVPAGGSAHVVFGGPNLASGNLGSGRTIRISGAQPGSQFGAALAGVGDVNKDGLDDVLVGANSQSSNGPFSGSAYLVLGDPTPSDIDLAQPPAGWVTFAGTGGEGAGYPVDGVGDVNQDGYPDMVIGANGGAGTRGVAYVVFGAKTPTGLTLSTMTPDQGAALTGEDPMDWAGHDVAGLGDVNGDGVPDVGVGAARAEPNGTQSGSAYVVYGTKDFTSLSLGALSGRGFQINGPTGSLTGQSMVGLGDMNADGFDDFAVGSPGDGDVLDFATLVFGRATSGTVDLANLGDRGLVFTGSDTSPAVGGALAGVGDVDADGHPDALIAAIEISATQDFAALVRGGPSLHGGSLSTWPDGFATAPGSYFGAGVAGLGDVNGDGGLDVAIGAPLAEPNALHYAGSVYIVYGKVPVNPPATPPPPVAPPPAAATLVVKARPAKKTIPRTGRVVLVRKVTVGPGQKATITLKTPKRVKVTKTASMVTVKTKRAPKGKVRVRIVATGEGVTPKLWVRTWKVR